MSILNTQYELKLCAVSNLDIRWTMRLQKWNKHHHFLLWCMFATKTPKLSWQGNTLNRLVKILRFCYYVLATVYEISLICRTVRLNSMFSCQTPTILVLCFTFNCNASSIFVIVFELFL